MKKRSLILLLGSAFIGVPSLAAANSVDLLIAGRLIPMACTPTLSGGAVIDYGDIPVASLHPKEAYTLEDRNVNLIIACQEDTALGIRITDARADTKPLLNREIPRPSQHSDSNLAVARTDRQTMGLGLDAVSGKLGVWWMHVDRENLKASNSESEIVSEAKLLYSTNNGKSWSRTTTSPLDPHYGGADSTTFAIKSIAATSPAVAVLHEFPLVVGGAINARGSLTVKDDTRLNGKGVFTIYYQ
ncbi:DUF1120 domain-containing protein [Chromobacterium alkanivorans]|uniref:DUF1120 domain-containing protein n=1 Tax=Chromobacterium alkanivorans TaxID=1071719 RepID=UPI0019688F4B|nr:DUF1120 domain-containing protein [Chromobacterium alkanivorans]MBN3006710.1 DUF1120 domain-containing protein [Chromobacterium alkanivorans]